MDNNKINPDNFKEKATELSENTTMQKYKIINVHKNTSEAIIAANLDDTEKANKLICELPIKERMIAASSFIQNEIERIKNDPNYSYADSRARYG